MQSLPKPRSSIPAEGEVLNSKKMRGSKAGAYIAIALTEETCRRLAAGESGEAALPQETPRRLVIGEGIETVLAVWTAHHAAGRPIGDMAFWAAGDLGNLAGRAVRTIPHPTLKRPNGRAQTVPIAIRIPTTRAWRFRQRRGADFVGRWRQRAAADRMRDGTRGAAICPGRAQDPHRVRAGGPRLQRRVANGDCGMTDLCCGDKTRALFRMQG